MMLRSFASRLLHTISNQPRDAGRLVKTSVNPAALSITCNRIFSTSLSLRHDSQSHRESSQNGCSRWLEDNLRLDIKDDERQTVIEAIPDKTGREERLISSPEGHSNACVLCKLNLRNLNYTDVMILAQFIKKNGSLVTYHESKLCSKQYMKVIRLIRDAQRCNLIQRPADYLVPGPWHNLNTYLEPDRRRDQPMKVIKKEYWKI